MYSWKKLWLFVALPRSKLFFFSVESQDFTVCFHFILGAFVLDFIVYLADFPSALFFFFFYCPFRSLDFDISVSSQFKLIQFRGDAMWRGIFKSFFLFVCFF